MALVDWPKGLPIDIVANSLNPSAFPAFRCRISPRRNPADRHILNWVMDRVPHQQQHRIIERK
ncbi:hypothetical protein X741_18620 [Mesorhizobium sp. LNHC229A00]|nr:hypothetical protein X741_18620 [Mesorhizobium sp. LNHC229A00]